MMSALLLCMFEVRKNAAILDQRLFVLDGGCKLGTACLLLQAKGLKMPIEGALVHMLGEYITAVVVARNLLEGEITLAQPVFDPEVGCRKVTYLPQATTPAHPDSRRGICLEGYLPVEAQVLGH